MKVNAIAIATLLACGAAQAASEQVTIHAVSAQGIGNAIGTVNIEETQYGLQLTPMLEGLKPGIHGFHVHAKGSCEPGESEGKRVAAGAAGGILIRRTPASTWGPMLRAI